MPRRKPVSLDRVAQLARVARSTVHSVFGSRAGLFDAFVDDLWARTGLPELTEAVANPDARQHLRSGIAAASAMEAERAGGMAQVATRLAEDGHLRDGISVERALDVLWMICRLDAFDQLYTGRQLGLDATAEILVGTAEAALCR